VRGRVLNDIDAFPVGVDSGIAVFGGCDVDYTLDAAVFVVVVDDDDDDDDDDD
jgi:hypothetical protein